jgi:hypothetical protein
MPGLAHLRATPRVLRDLLAGVTDAEGAWKPAPQRWSILEVLGHLWHVESRGFRGRIERMVKEDNPTLVAYNPEAHAAAGDYGGRTLAEALDNFTGERNISMDFLETLPARSAERPGIHGELGPLTVRNLLYEWPLHDLGHVRQIAELIRAVRYFPHIGPWQRAYNINP